MSAAAAGTGALLLLLGRRWGWRLHTACVACFAAAVAFASYTLYDARQIAPFEVRVGQTVLVEGIITDAHAHASSTSYTMKARFPELPLPGTRVVIRSYGEMEQLAGDTVRCSIKLYSTADTNAESYYRKNGVAIMGTVVDEVQQISTGDYRYDRLVIRLRERLYENVYSKLPGDYGDVVTTMVLGNQEGVSPEVYSSVNRSGTVHLLSVSGLHLSILVAFLLAIFQRLRIPGRLGAALAILFAFLFMVLVGFGSSIFRSFVMTAMMLGGQVVSRRGDSLNSLGAAMLISCVIWPHWVLGRGLWLSAGATLGILLYGQTNINRLTERLRTRSRAVNYFIRTMLGAWVISMSAYVFTLPILLITNGWISLIAPVTNVLITPFVAPIILGGVVCALTGSTALPIRVVVWVTEICTRMVLELSKLTARLPYAITAIDQAYLLIWIAGVVAALVVAAIYRGDKKLLRYVAALCVLTFSLGGISLQVTNKNTIELATIAECDAAVLLRGNEAVILGTPSHYEVNRLIKYLDFRGVRRIAAVIAPDCTDQIGSGLTRLGSGYGIDCIVGPNDAYILGELELVMKDSLIYSGGYATVDVLGGAQVSTGLMTGDIRVQIGANSILKKREDCAILERYTGRAIRIYNSGTILLPPRTPHLVEPVGRALFGETRVLLHVD